MELTIKDYSDKAIAVYGNTKEIKDRLKELGGRFNPHLRDGAGWVFSKSKEDALKQFVATLTGVAQVVPDTQPINHQPVNIPIGNAVAAAIQKMDAKVGAKPAKQKAATQYTDVVCEGFVEGTFRMANSKVEKFCKQIIKARDTHYKNTPHEEGDAKHRVKFTFINVR